MQIQYVEHPKYLGVTLDRSLTYNTHSSKTVKKVAARVNLVRKLTGANWRASAEILRTASLALVYWTTEYCAPVWLNSVHTSKIDIQLNNTITMAVSAGEHRPHQNNDVKQPLLVNW
jgi:hypothetical protein